MPSLASRIAAVRRELAGLEQQQRDALIASIVAIVGAGVAFSAAELWQHQVVYPALWSALHDAGIRSPRQLGKRLRALGLQRVGADHDGAIWVVGS